MNILFYSNGQDTQSWLAQLQHRLPDIHIQQWQPDGENIQADYALLWKPPEQFFAEQQNLKGIINLGAGVDGLLKLPNLPTDVPLLKLRDAGMSRWMNDYIRYGVLHFTRDFDRYRTQQQSAHWHDYDIEPSSHWPVVVLGAGALGQSAAQELAQQGFPVRCWSRSPKQIEGVTSFSGEEGLFGCLSGARLVINLLPHTPATRGLINTKTLSRLAEGAALISCGRGEIIDMDALVAALDSEQLRGALLDVFDTEPLPADSPLWQHPKAIITPHIAAPTPIAEAVEQIIGYLEQLEAGQRPQCVDPTLGY